IPRSPGSRSLSLARGWAVGAHPRVGCGTVRQVAPVFAVIDLPRPNPSACHRVTRYRNYSVAKKSWRLVLFPEAFERSGAGVYLDAESLGRPRRTACGPSLPRTELVDINPRCIAAR